ncbi:hypothetical protein QQ045_003505 [Rhodiola kirilowii]
MSIISSLPPSQPSPSLPMEDSIPAAQWLITKWRYNHVSPSFLFLTNSQEAKEYIQCVHELRRIMDFYISTHSESPNIALAHNLIQSAMQRLEMEFHHLLSINSEYFKATLTSSEQGDYDMLSNSFAEDLKTIAHCMIKAGYGIECARAYKLVRKRAVDEELVNLGFQKLRSIKVNKEMSDEELDQRVRTWIQAINLAVGRVLHGERILCDHIFSGASDALGESSFSQATTKGAINIFITGEMVANAKGKSSTKHIFRLMEMHIAIQEAIPEIESIFSFESTSLVHTQALNSLTKLRNSIHSLLDDFESSLKKHSTKPGVSGGGIHTLTQSTMDHIARLADYSPVLSSIITDHPSPADKTWMPESYFNTTAAMDSPISIRFARIILVLLCKLDKIADTYKDISLSYLFLANNLHLVVEKVRCTFNLLSLIGEAWVITHHRISKQYASKYEFTAWHKVIKSITLEEEASPLSTKAVKERLRKFESAFEEAIRKQRSWTVVDERMREDLKALIAGRVASAYAEFHEASAEYLDAESIVRLGPAEMEIYVSDLFRGVSASGDLSPGSSSSYSSSASSSSSSSSPKRRFFNRVPNKRVLNDRLDVV